MLFMLCVEIFTSLSQRTGVGRVWVSVVITEVFGNIVACQLGHNVGDVAERTQVLQAFVSTPLWKKNIHNSLQHHHEQKKRRSSCAICCLLDHTLK